MDEHGELTAGAEVIIGDAGVTKTVAEAVVGMDHVVFALGSLVPPEAEEEPHLDLSLTLQPLLELLGVLAQGPRVPVSNVSSGGTVYGNARSFPIPETAQTVPLSVYGITRLTAESPSGPIENAARSQNGRARPPRLRRD